MSIIYLERKLIIIQPQPEYIKSTGCWSWPLPGSTKFNYWHITHAVTASREWWEYVPPEAKPHLFAEGVKYSGVWYWAVPKTGG